MQLEEVAVDELNLVRLGELVDLGVVAGVVQFLRVHVGSDAEATLPTKLDGVATDAAKGVQNVGALIVALVAHSFGDPLRDVLSHRLRSHGVP